MRTAAALLTSLAAVILVWGAHAADPSISVGLMHDPKELWSSIMTGFYGPYDRRLRCWIGLDAPSGQHFCMRPLRLDREGSRSSPSLFAAVGGRPIGDDGKVEDGHAPPGALAFIELLDNGGPSLTVTGRSDLETIGSWGLPPPRNAISVREIGPNNLGWVVSEFYQFTGVGEGARTYYGLHAGKIAEIGSVNTSYDDGNGICGDGCAHFSATLHQNAAAGDAPVYPLRADVSGTANGKTISKSFVIAFDEKSFTYEVPPDLIDIMNNGCEELCGGRTATPQLPDDQ